MEYKTANEKFLKIEHNCNVFDIYVDGVQIWDFIRLSLSDQVKSVVEGQDTENRGYTSKQDVKLSTPAEYNPFTTDKKDYIFYSHGRRKKLEDGLWWDLYLDPIIEDTNLDYVCLERNGDSNHPKPSKTRFLKHNDLISDISNLFQKIYEPDMSLSNENRRKLNEIDDRFDHQFGIEVNLVELVVDVLKQVKTKAPVYSTWLEQVDPKAVITWARPRYLIHACKRLNIPVIELQHGVVHRYQYDYSYPNVSHVDTFPDYLFVFGEPWTGIVDYPISRDQIRVVGYSFADRQFKMYKGRKVKKQVVFLSQPSIGEKLSRLATEFAHDNREYQLVYKLHPREVSQWENDYPWLKNADIRIASSEDQPLYALLSESEAQVGVTSTALYEGALFDTETYILKQDNMMQVEYLLNNGARLIDSSSDLNSCLNDDQNAMVKGDEALMLNQGQVVFDEIESVVDGEAACR